MRSLVAGTLVGIVGLGIVGCGGSDPPPRAAQPQPYPQQPGYPPPQQQGYPQQQQPYPQQPYPQQQQPYPQQPYPQAQPYPQQPYPPQQQPYPQPTQPAPTQPAPTPAPTAAPAPMLPPLLGSPAWRTETAQVLRELIAALPASSKSKVDGIPLSFENFPNEINAYAGCDEKGKPFMAATEGLLLAVDALSQTKSYDETAGTHTYEQYADRVTPQLVRSETATPALPAGIVPPQAYTDLRRLSRARELFQEVIAFTFAHELAHHYLGHTGCAVGTGAAAANAATLGHAVTTVIPGLNQPNELAADNVGVWNVLDAGRARAPQYRWTENGGLLLLDFFGRLSNAAGVSPLHPAAILRSHPNPQLRVPIVQNFARLWYSQRR